MAQAFDLLAAEAAERHRRVTVILDEAHLAAPDQLEELRLMLNAEMDSASPFAAILAGQPTSTGSCAWARSPPWTSGSRPGSPSSRWTRRSASYLRRRRREPRPRKPRLRRRRDTPRLHRVASGLPRARNNAGAAALMAAAAAGEDLVDDACARKAVAELTRD